MSKECKTARNAVMSAVMVLAALILIMSMSSCGTWKFVEPMGPNAANNLRFNNSICR